VTGYSVWHGVVPGYSGGQVMYHTWLLGRPVPEIIDTVFTKTSPKRSFSMTEYERFGLVFTKTRVYKFGHRSTWLSGRLKVVPALSR
jgi:hypothetical protein